MKKGKVSRFLATILVVAMSVSFVACGNSDGDSSFSSSTDASVSASTSTTDVVSETKKPQKLVTLKFRGTDSNPVPGIQKNDVMNEIVKLLGIEIDFSIADSVKDKVALAGGDLPDIMQISNVTAPDFSTYIKGDHIIPLDDLVARFGQDIMKNAPKMIEFSKLNISAGTGKLYGLTAGNYLNKGTTPMFTYRNGLIIRWDYYKELGCPEIKNPYELLDVLKQMQAKHPKTVDGKKVYGISGWTDWGLWPFYIPYAFTNGYMNGGSDMYLFTADGSIQPSFTESGGVFKDSMKFMNKAYNMGLVDPEMFTQKNSDFIAKNKNLQFLSVPADWWNGDALATMQAQGIKNGSYYVIPGSTKITWEGYGSPVVGGLGDRLFAISKNCKEPERAMHLLNFFFSIKGNMLLRNGIENKHWSVVNGKPEIMDETLKMLKNDANFGMTSGRGALNTNLYNNLCGLSRDSRDENGNFLGLDLTDKVMKYQVTEADKDYCAQYKVEYPGQASMKAESEGKTKIEFFDNTWQSLMPVQSSDAKLIEGKITNYQLPFVARLIMSKSDEDFEKNWEKGTADIKAMGYEQLMKELSDNNAIALKKLSQIR